MPLFTDSSLIDISDLSTYESTLSKIASTHNINIESKTAITLASIGDRLLGRLVRAGGVRNTTMLPSATQRYSIVSLPPRTSWLLTLDNVVVTQPLKRWMCYELLSQIFSEAYNVQLNDRFKQKWLDYSARAQETERSLYDLGIGVVYRPLGQPALAQVTIIPGDLPAGLYTVQTSWVDSDGAESNASPLVPVTLTAPASMVVSIAPGSQNIPAAAAGWNVYIAQNGMPPARQNTARIALNTTWTIPSTGLIPGAAPVDGQQPDDYVLDPQRTWRG